MHGQHDRMHGHNMHGHEGRRFGLHGGRHEELHREHHNGPHDGGGPRGRGGPRGPRGPFGGFGGPFGGPGGPGGFGGFGGPGFGRGRRTGRGDVRAAALSLLVQGPLHGYQIIQEIAERTGGAWKPSPGSVYPMLQQLADEGLVRAEESDGRRVFTLTEAGQTYANERQAEFAAVWEAATGADNDARQELWEGFGQLAAAMRQVGQAGTPAQIAAASRLLAETRRQLYRILAGDAPAGDAPASATPAPEDATRL